MGSNNIEKLNELNLLRSSQTSCMLWDRGEVGMELKVCALGMLT